MNTTNHPSQDDLALFALQLLPEPETVASLDHLRACDDCRRQIAEFQGDLVLYAMLSDPETPPPHARERLLRSVAAEPRNAAATEPVSAVATTNVVQMPSPTVAPRKSSFVPFTGWAVAACLAVAAGLLYRDRQVLRDELLSEKAVTASAQENAAAAHRAQAALSALTSPAALNVVLHQPTAAAAEAAKGPEAHAAYLPDQGALVFVASNLEPLQPYKVYELWLLPAEKGKAPIAAGSFRPDAAGHANMIMPTGPHFVPISGFGVTREDANAAPAKPTLPILLMGSSKT